MFCSAPAGETEHKIRLSIFEHLQISYYARFLAKSVPISFINSTIDPHKFSPSSRNGINSTSTANYHFSYRADRMHFLSFTYDIFYIVEVSTTGYEYLHGNPV